MNDICKKKYSFMLNSTNPIEFNGFLWAAFNKKLKESTPAPNKI